MVCATVSSHLLLLQSKIQALAHEAHSQQAAGTSFLEWRSIKAPVRHERVRLALHTANELSSQIDNEMDTDAAATTQEAAIEERLALYDRVINAYNEARAAVRNLIKASAGMTGWVVCTAAHEQGMYQVQAAAVV